MFRNSLFLINVYYNLYYNNWSIGRYINIGWNMLCVCLDIFITGISLMGVITSFSSPDHLQMCRGNQPLGRRLRLRYDFAFFSLLVNIDFKDFSPLECILQEWSLLRKDLQLLPGTWSVTENIICYLVCNREYYLLFGLKQRRSVYYIYFYERNLISFFVKNMPAANITILAHVMLIIYALIKKNICQKYNTGKSLWGNIWTFQPSTAEERMSFVDWNRIA